MALDRWNNHIIPAVGRRVFISFGNPTHHSVIKARGIAWKPDFDATYIESTHDSQVSANAKSTFPPGLMVCENFVSKAEEAKLLECINEYPSSCHLKLRQVKHFGYFFDYDTCRVSRTPVPAIPTLCSDLIERMPYNNSQPPLLDQLTVNVYDPGAGIPPHIDTPLAFGDAIYIISLGSGIAMTFSNQSKQSPVKIVREESQEVSLTNAAAQQQGCIQANVEHSSQFESQSQNQVKHGTTHESDRHCGSYLSMVEVYLPARCLAIIAGEARYKWTHGIAARKTDSVAGIPIPRERRVSLTFRKAILPEEVDRAQ
eukprot:gene767-4056_t